MNSPENSIWQFATASNIRFGRGSARLLGEELKRYGIRRPLIVTDSTITTLTPYRDMLEKVPNAVEQFFVFDGCKPEPTVDIAEQAIAMGREKVVDAVIGVGGGSNLDVAKMAAVVLKHGGRPQQYFGFDAVPGPILPILALPTTAGTGSEVSHSSVLTDPAQGTKVSTLSRWLRPTVAIIDPRFTDSCPAVVTAHSGIDALVHAIEATTNRPFQEMHGVDPQTRAYEGSYPFTQLIASEAIRLISRSLVRAYETPQDYVARDEMAVGAMLAGMAFSNSGVALVHALEYPLGVLTHCSHGEGNGLLLPHVMRFNLPAAAPALARVAEWMGCETAGLATEAAAERAIEAVVELQRRLRIRTKMRDLGLTADQIPIIAHRAIAIKRLVDINPRRASEEELVHILEQAF